MYRQVIQEIQDLRRLDWSKVRHSSGTAGSFLKSREMIRGVKWYYKLSDYDAYRGIVGHECINELIADRLLTILQIPHLPYQLIHARIQIEDKEIVTWLCRSKDYKRPDESKIALDTFYQMERLVSESPLDFCIRQGWAEYVYQMLVIDFLAPLFDQGLSLFCSIHNEKDLENADPMADRRVQCFVGSGSAVRNLGLIPREHLRVPGKLRETDREYLFRDLSEALPPAYQDAIWEMIWRRWEYYESLCDS